MGICFWSKNGMLGCDRTFQHGEVQVCVDIVEVGMPARQLLAAIH